ncbi:type-F conjugative transfer system pilin assembly protein TrbC [Sinimarinibacterium sp. NLF-5-8]|uniref:type-F conjugative transfer system pilin assembly protein TrbC n=1 Tax=Sinimarinibacterium sp. NLF-5-8 TaxID=2698684 RepID=UPI00137C27B2|nr:type-F conjugative transfer system pilin assembly protein TrbC [Sinimarinibacterium sp. NLF-5-8]QHS09088.1 hypothetical protein GT972_02270 [Sinimarinibacterium sp. NLF-5-8]
MIWRGLAALSMLGAGMACAQPPEDVEVDLSVIADPAGIAEQNRHLFDNTGGLDRLTQIKDLPDDLEAKLKASRDAVMADLDQQQQQAYQQRGIEADEAEKLGNLMILVSSSMPESMLRGYAQQAQRVGGALIYRGMLGESFADFLKEQAAPMMLGDNLPTPLMIDPRMFTAYQVDAVPAIIYTSENFRDFCAKAQKVEVDRGVDAQGEPLPPLEYQDCQPSDPDRYWKISGAVSVSYALQQFADAGAPGAARLLELIRPDPFAPLEQQAPMLSSDDYQASFSQSSINQVKQMLKLDDPWFGVDTTQTNTLPTLLEAIKDKP